MNLHEIAIDSPELQYMRARHTAFEWEEDGTHLIYWYKGPKPNHPYTWSRLEVRRDYKRQIDLFASTGKINV